MVEVRSDIGYIKKELGEIKEQLSKFIEASESRYVSSDNVSEMKKDIRVVKKAMNKMELRWASYTGGAVVIIALIQLALHFI